MSKLQTVLQLYSVRDFAEKDLQATLNRVKEMGYNNVELAGMYGLRPEQLKSRLDAAGLSALSAHVPFPDFEADAESTVQKYKAVGCRYVAVPWLEEEYRPGGARFETTLSVINTAGKLCVENGMTLLYHNHDFEFEKMTDGQFKLDFLYGSVPADILQTEIDTCWVKFAGQDPQAYIRKYAGRCPVVHLKDFADEGGTFEFRPVGYGIQDFSSIIQAAEESGTSLIVVEQDISVGRTSIEAAKMSREYLKSLGY